MNNSGSRIVVVNYGNIFDLPPVLNVVRCLLHNKYHIILISENISDLSKDILNNEFFKFVEIDGVKGKSFWKRVWKRLVVGKKYRKNVLENISENDIIWTIGDGTVRVLGKIVLKYRHVMHLTELAETTPFYNGARILKFPMAKYAKHAWKTVVPERNRAYIQQIWWGDTKTPYVLPNKPYCLKAEKIASETEEAVNILKNEKRKIIIYLGVFGGDRNLSIFAEATKMLGKDFCLYLAGRISGSGNYDTNREEFLSFLKRYDNVHYLGFFNAPEHLELLKYSNFGILPYYINKSKPYDYQINALYCAPNKIYEYAAFNIPMIGTDVLGLREPFEKYNIGVCCEKFDAINIAKAIQFVDKNHEIMSSNCKVFYDSVNLDHIVNEILENEK